MSVGIGLKYARLNEKTGEKQELIDHIRGVSDNTEKFTSEFLGENIGRVLGLLHDLGKYSDEFQERLEGIRNDRVDHSTAGAIVCDEIEKELWQNKKVEFALYKMFKYAIAGHHSGLLNYGNANAERCLSKRLLKINEICDYSDWKKELTYEEIKNIEFKKEDHRFLKSNFSIQMLIRFMFSSLVDGDRLDAQRFVEGEESVANDQNFMKLDDMLKLFDKYMQGKRNEGKQFSINSIRNTIFDSCIKESKGEKGFYSLCVPTGGGKTLSSLGFALNHAVKHGQKRIIYSLPFTSIIEQNAKVYADIFGEQNVLEHHCNVNFSNESNETYYDEKKLKYKLATENWNMPLIVTTNVQFFESMYSCKPSSVRKLHNISNSVIILDEAQVIPNEYLKPCMEALSELVRNYGCTVLICTATQPEFQKNGLISNDFNITEIIENTSKLFEDLKRVKGEFVGKQEVTDICEKMRSYSQVLTIVNTKKHAKEIFETLGKDDCNFHLSTNMYPKHRKKVIEQIRQRLKENKECRVVSTQLIEAGVDIDFPVVFRSVAGIDSIVQAAGRCNREGKRDIATVYVFEPSDSKYVGFGYLKNTSRIGEFVINESIKKSKDFLELESISKYFSMLFDLTEKNQDKYDILKMIDQYTQLEVNYRFEDISDEFRFINDVGTQVVIVEEEVKELIRKLNYTDKGIKGIIRMLNEFSVNIPEHAFKDLFSRGVIREAYEGVFVIENLDYYDSKVGLDKEKLENYII